eukprot:TRINITY_DN1004_c0_g2_i2.p1 TRINITY_DN1004_c0_g2~~TRINITY_DN1004_c0_g2_i2.p1  ORF type:complete len:814 (+),score=232.98 TRINITY_DN1004_c0_g2_i2:126-2567(+)
MSEAAQVSPTEPSDVEMLHIQADDEQSGLDEAQSPKAGGASAVPKDGNIPTPVIDIVDERGFSATPVIDMQHSEASGSGGEWTVGGESPRSQLTGMSGSTTPVGQRRGVQLRLRTSCVGGESASSVPDNHVKLMRLRETLSTLNQRLGSLQKRRQMVRGESSNTVSIDDATERKDKLSTSSRLKEKLKEKVKEVGKIEVSVKRTQSGLNGDVTHEESVSSMHDLVMAKLRLMKKNSEYSSTMHHMWAREHNTGYIPGSPLEWQEWYGELDHRSGQGQVWLDLATPAAEDDTVSFRWGDFNMNIGQAKTLGGRGRIQQNYDVTPERLLHYYAKADKDCDGSLVLHEIVWILKQHDFGYLSTRFRDIFQATKVSSGQDIGNGLTLPEFGMMYTCLKLAQLVKESPRSAMRGGVQLVDFCSDDVICQTIYARDDLVNFWFGHRKRNYKRWVHVVAPKEPLILHLAVKYHLHPLGVKDTIKFTESDEALPASFDRFGNHYYMRVCYCYLTSTNPVRYKTANIVLFVAGAPKWDTVISFVNPELQSQPTREFGPLRQHLDVWSILQQTIKASNCRVRDQKSDFLAYEILCICFEELKPITVAERKQLALYHQVLMEKKHAFPTEYLQHLSRIVVELGELHRSIRPLKHLVNQLLDEPHVSKFTKTYLFNLDTDIQQGIDDIQLLRETCKSLTDDYHRFNEMRLNDALGLLTVASAVFMPAQFVSGVFGMNFEYMPELKWQYGYLCLWIFFIVYFVFGGYVAWAKFGSIVKQKDDVEMTSMTAVVAVGDRSSVTSSRSTRSSTSSGTSAASPHDSEDWA